MSFRRSTYRKEEFSVPSQLRDLGKVDTLGILAILYFLLL